MAIKCDLEEVVFVLAVLTLSVLFGGEPDLGDAIQKAIIGTEISCGK